MWYNLRDGGGVVSKDMNSKEGEVKDKRGGGEKRNFNMQGEKGLQFLMFYIHTKYTLY